MTFKSANKPAKEDLAELSRLYNDWRRLKLLRKYASQVWDAKFKELSQQKAEALKPHDEVIEQNVLLINKLKKKLVLKGMKPPYVAWEIWTKL